jgi:hypothetical protein
MRIRTCTKCRHRIETMTECEYGYNQNTGYNMRSNYHCERFAKSANKAQKLRRGLKDLFYTTAEFEDTDGRSFDEWVEFIAEQGNEDAQKLLNLEAK